MHEVAQLFGVKTVIQYQSQCLRAGEIASFNFAVHCEIMALESQNPLWIHGSPDSRWKLGMFLFWVEVPYTVSPREAI